MYQFYAAEGLLLFRGTDRNGSFLCCFPCGGAFTSAANLLMHLVTSEEHFLGKTIPIDLEYEVMRQQGFLIESPSDAIA